jgi:hypothetical protein
LSFGNVRRHRPARKKGACGTPFAEHRRHYGRRTNRGKVIRERADQPREPPSKPDTPRPPCTTHDSDPPRAPTPIPPTRGFPIARTAPSTGATSSTPSNAPSATRSRRPTSGDRGRRPDSSDADRSNPRGPENAAGMNVSVVSFAGPCFVEDLRPSRFNPQTPHRALFPDQGPPRLSNLLGSRAGPLRRRRDRGGSRLRLRPDQSRNDVGIEVGDLARVELGEGDPGHRGVVGAERDRRDE